MEEKSEQNQNLHKQEISELENKLKLANQVITSLQHQNTELKKQATNSLTGATTRIPQTTTNQTKGVSMSKYRFSQLSHFQFYALTVSVVLLIISIFSLSSFFSRRDGLKKTEVRKNTSPPTAQAIPTLTTAFPISVNTPSQNQGIVPLNSNPLLLSNTSEFTYNIVTSPKLTKGDKKLDKIVKSIVNYAEENKLPTSSLSVTLIDLNKNTTAAYQEDKPRYPASVAKLFWMVALEAKIKQGQVQFAAVYNDLNTMMLKSDNDAASNVIDAITNTKSSDKKLEQQEFATWKYQRQSLNDFFQKAGYKDINISQKTFPLPLHNIQAPKGADAQIRGDNPNSPRRNKVTTYQAARLMYEIARGEAVAPESQESMLNLLKRDLGYWQSQPPNPEEFDPVRDLFGEKLPANRVEFYSKAGWTTTSRQEVAYIVSKDRKASYILAIFGDDKAYGDSKKAFPQMSRLVFDQLTN